MMTKKDLEALLQKIEGNDDHKRHEFEIEASFQDFPRIIKMGRTAEERIRIFKMCYMVAPTRHELLYWSLDELLQYIKETDENYEQDLALIQESVLAIYNLA